MMRDVVVALDIGGTKVHLVIETVSGERITDIALPSSGWDCEPIEQGAAWIAQFLETHLPKDIRIASLAFGAQGINSSELGNALQRALEALGYHATAVNDAALVVAAAGFENGIGIIAGTGAIGVSTDADGNYLAAGGWGCVIGDEGGAAALVREAARAALKAHDAGNHDDGLLGALIAAFDVSDAERLTRKVNDEPTSENWAPHCPALFDAADAGSALAQSVITQGGQALAALVCQLRARGAVGRDVIIAGSVISNQRLLSDAFEASIHRFHPDLSVHRLDVAPVEGALAIARRCHSPV